MSKVKPVRCVLLTVLTVGVAAFVFRGVLCRSAVALMQRVKGRATVDERLQQFGAAARSRMAPDFQRIALAYPPRRVTLVGLKHEKRLEVWVADATGSFQSLRSYPILGASGTLGPKLREGDRQVPEGVYRIDSLNPNSLYHVALRVNYPNEFDMAKGAQDGRKNLGGDIVIHGKTGSVGCLAMGDPAAEDLFCLAADTGLHNIAVILSPVDLRVQKLPPELLEDPPWAPDSYETIKQALAEMHAEVLPSHPVDAPWQKVQLDLTSLDYDGLRGPADGKVAVALGRRKRQPAMQHTEARKRGRSILVCKLQAQPSRPWSAIIVARLACPWENAAMRWGHVAGVIGLTAAVSAGAGVRITSLQVAPTVAYPPATGAGYAVSNHVSSEGVEVQLRLHGHHFATIVTNGSVMAIRPHPGVDRNGWGSTLYLQPFIARAVLGHATIRSATVSPAGVLLDVSGLVAQGAVGSYGSWSITNLVLRYDPLGKRVTGGGVYRIALDGPVAAAGGDLNLYKLASNYLDDVPLLDGTVGDTGDMTHADYTTDSTSDTWVPPLQPGHYPGPATDRLSITAHGDFCDVDTLAQSETNFRAIQAAYKPSLRVDLVAQVPGYGLIPGFGYQTSLSRIYLADNVGITPVITSGSVTTQFVYDVAIESWALPGDGTGMDVLLYATADVATNWTSIEVYMEESLAVCRTNRLVGFIGHTGTTNYHGSVEIPQRPGSDDNGGYLRLVAPYRSNSTPP